MPEDAREMALYKYLANLKPETFDGHFNDIWREYGTLLMAEKLLDLAKKANLCIRTSKLTRTFLKICCTSINLLVIKTALIGFFL